MESFDRDRFVSDDAMVLELSVEILKLGYENCLRPQSCPTKNDLVYCSDWSHFKIYDTITHCGHERRNSHKEIHRRQISCYPICDLISNCMSRYRSIDASQRALNIARDPQYWNVQPRPPSFARSTEWPWKSSCAISGYASVSHCRHRRPFFETDSQVAKVGQPLQRHRALRRLYVVVDAPRRYSGASTTASAECCAPVPPSAQCRPPLSVPFDSATSAAATCAVRPPC